MSRTIGAFFLPLLVGGGLVLVALRAPGEPRAASLSLGNPNEGKLVGGVRMPVKGRGFYSNPHCPNEDAKYGTEELIAALVKTGRDVHRWAPGGTLYINDLGFREGGQIPHHQSHQAGRDVDLLFYMLDEQGELTRPRAVHFDKQGAGAFDNGTRNDRSDDVPVTFDVRRNWLVLKSLLSNREAHVQRVFVAEGLRGLMLRHARKTGERRSLIERAGELTCQPRSPHDDHFHIRLYCTEEDYRQGCRDAWPIYP